MNGLDSSRTDPQAHAGIRARIAGFAYVALLPPAAFAVHQLRYWLAFGSKAGIELQRTGHSYLHSVVPWLVLLLALAVGGFLRALGRAFAGHTSPARFTLSLTAMWLVCSAALVAIFACQEFLEGLFATGHPAGWVGIFGYGGWWSIPAALCIGLVLAAVLHGARWLVREVAHRRARPYLLLSDQCCVWRVPAMRWSCVRRRWSVAGRVGVRRRSVETRCSLGCEPRGGFCLL